MENTTTTQEGLARLIAKMPTDSRSIYFYTVSGTQQKLNPGVETVSPEQSNKAVSKDIKQGDANV